MRYLGCGGDRKSREHSGGHLFYTTSGVCSSPVPDTLRTKRTRGSRKAAALLAALQSGGQHGCGIEVNPSNVLTPICASGRGVLNPVANQRLASRRRPRVISTISTPRAMSDVFVMFTRDSSDTEVETLLLPELPASPKERQKAFVDMLVGFVKARDADSAIALYGMAGDLGVKPTVNVFNALLSLCEGDRVSLTESWVTYVACSDLQIESQLETEAVTLRLLKVYNFSLNSVD